MRLQFRIEGSGGDGAAVIWMKAKLKLGHAHNLGWRMVEELWPKALRGWRSRVGEQRPGCCEERSMVGRGGGRRG